MGECEGCFCDLLCMADLCVLCVTVYMFDEPSSYLDVKQRLNASLCIRSLLTEGKQNSFSVALICDEASDTLVVCVSFRSFRDLRRARSVGAGLSVGLHLRALRHAGCVWCRDAAV